MSAAVALGALVVVGAPPTIADGHGSEIGTRAASSPQVRPETIPDNLLWHNQDLLDDFRAWTAALPGAKDSGFVTLMNDAGTRRPSTTLVWHGPSDPLQHQIMDEARRRNISITVQNRKYGMADLERAAAQLMDIGPGNSVFENFDYNSVSIFSAYFDGTIVRGTYIDDPAEGVPAADIALEKALTALTGVATKIDHEVLKLH